MQLCTASWHAQSHPHGGVLIVLPDTWAALKLEKEVISSSRALSGSWPGFAIRRTSIRSAVPPIRRKVKISSTHCCKVAMAVSGSDTEATYKR